MLVQYNPIISNFVIPANNIRHTRAWILLKRPFLQIVLSHLFEYNWLRVYKAPFSTGEISEDGRINVSVKV
ncbi:hypothetical protein D3C76_1146200 [compost metagenome]